ncbi:hypothetical protein LCGC14_2571200, partial [marine sediment metagenome]
METGITILTRGLPKTGQTITYHSEGDGAYQAGWWKGKLNVNNKTRFVLKTINGDKVVIDRATGLMWAADGDEAGCNESGILYWDEALPYAYNLTFAGFSDWRIPNINELGSIINFGKETPAIDQPPFD